MTRKIFIITAIVSGILLGLQIRSFKAVEFLVERSQPATILAQLRTFQIANESLREQVRERQEALDGMQSKIAVTSLEDEINNLRLLAGQEAVTGPGIEITLSAAVKAFWLYDLMTELFSAGAEAIAVNDIRLTLQSAGIRDVSNGLLMRRYLRKPPFKITVIGPTQDMRSAIAQNGGIIDKIKSAYPGSTILLAERDSIIIPALPEE